MLMKRIGESRCILVGIDAFYKDLTYRLVETVGDRPEESKDVVNYDFDRPEALDFQQIEECMRSLSEGKDTNIPLYDFKTNGRYRTQ